MSKYTMAIKALLKISSRMDRLARLWEESGICGADGYPFIHSFDEIALDFSDKLERVMINERYNGKIAKTDYYDSSFPRCRKNFVLGIYTLGMEITRAYSKYGEQLDRLNMEYGLFYDYSIQQVIHGIDVWYRCQCEEMGFTPDIPKTKKG